MVGVVVSGESTCFILRRNFSLCKVIQIVLYITLNVDSSNIDTRVMVESGLKIKFFVCHRQNLLSDLFFQVAPENGNAVKLDGNIKHC